MDLDAAARDVDRLLAELTDRNALDRLLQELADPDTVGRLLADLTDEDRRAPPGIAS